MDSAIEKQSIYEIYRACRLCGAGAGYKMPIIQSFVDLDDRDVQLKEKILDCVQIEVRQDDKMPPLICELCVDKVNDFYEFLSMCKQTNTRTRIRLGLPQPSTLKESSDNSDCILGVTEAIYVNSDSDTETPKNKRPQQNKIRVKKPSELKEPQLKVQLQSLKDKSRPKPRPKSKREPTPPRSSRSKPRDSDDDISFLEDELLVPRTTRTKTKREPTPPRNTRLARSSKDDDMSLSRFQDRSAQYSKPGPKSILKKEKDLKVVIKREDSSLLVPKLKRLESEPPSSDTPAKKVKITTKLTPPSPVHAKTKPPPKPTSTPKPAPKSMSTPKSSPRPSPKSAPKAPPPERADSPPISYECGICTVSMKSSQGFSNHMRIHQVSFTSPRLACNACRDWFSTAEEAQAHHRRHKSVPVPYTCRHCFADFKTEHEYEKHFGQKLCIPVYEVSDIKCDECWHMFPTHNLYNDHKCPGEDGRPGGKCFRCKRSHALLRHLMRHEINCSSKKKRGDIWVPSSVLRVLKPLQVRVARCDPLLDNTTGEHYDVASVPVDFGYDSNFVYPFYMSALRAFDGMVSIEPDVKEELCNEQFVHWDSESETDDTSLIPKNNVKRLGTLSLKTIFSQKCLGKVPRIRKKVKTDKNAFDSLFNDGDDDVRTGINNIIDNLDDDLTNNDNDQTVSASNDTLNGISEINDSVVNVNEESIDKTDVSIDKRSSSEAVSTVNGDVHTTNDVSGVNDTSSFKSNDKPSNNNDEEKNGVSNDASLNDSVKDKIESRNDYADTIKSGDNTDVSSAIVNSEVHSIYNNDTSMNDKAVSENNDTESVNNDVSQQSDIDDKRLMDELDAQIADNSGSNDIYKRAFNDKRKSKSKIEGDSATKKNDNSMDLDRISDEEFNFDN